MLLNPYRFGPALPAATLQAATVQNRPNDSTITNAGCDGETVYLDHIVGADLDDIGFSHNGWFVTSAGLQLDTDPYNIVEAAIIANGVAVQVFHSGSASKAIAAGATREDSDRIPAASFGLSKILRGSIIKTKIIYSYSLGGKMPTGIRDVRSVSGQQCQRFASSATTPSTAVATGPFTYTGTAPTAAGNFPISPIMIGTHSRNALFVVGDSINHGSNEYTGGSVVGAAGIGRIQRALHDAAGPDVNPIACINMSRGGLSTVNFYGDNAKTKWRAYMDLAKVPVNGLGANDEGAGSSNLSPTALQNNDNTVEAILRANFSARTIRQKLLPRVTNWAMAPASQVPTGACWEVNGAADKFNDYLDTLDGTTYTVVPYSQIRFPGSEWRVNVPSGVDASGTASGTVYADTTHPNDAGHEYEAVVLRPIFAAAY